MKALVRAMPLFGRRALLAGVLACVAARGARAGSFDDFFAAIKRNNLSPLLGLLLRGFDVNTLDEKGLHGLHVALRADSLEVAIYLATLTGVNVDSLTPQGESPLMIALLRGHFTVAQALVKHGADVNKPGWTPLHYAATHAGPDALAQVAFLLENHAYIDAESPNGTTPLMMAAQYGEPEVLRLLLKEGADARLANQQKLTAIDFAQRGSRPTSAEILRAHLQASPTPGKW
jgi:ankyrin repeat protein